MIRIIESLQKLIFLVFLVVFAFFFLPFTPEFYMTHKFYLVATVALLLSGLSIVKFAFSRKLTMTKVTFGNLLLFFVFARILSLIFMSPNKIQALTSLPLSIGLLVALLLLFINVASLIRHEKNETEIFSVMSIGGIVLSIITIVMFIQPFNNIALPVGLEFLKNPFFNPSGNHFEAVYYLGFIFVYAATTLVLNKKSRNLLNFGALITTFIALALSFFVIVTNKNEAIFRLPPLTPSWHASVETLKDWRTATLGVGPDNFGMLYAAVKSPTYNQSDLWQLNFNQSRSALLHIWADSGILGLFAMLLLVAAAIREVLWLKGKHDDYAKIYAVLGMYLVFLLLFFPVSITFFTLMTLYLAALARSVSKHEEGILHIGKHPFEIDLRKNMLLLLMLVIVGLAGIGVLVYGAVRAYTAELYVKKSIDGLQRNNATDLYNNQLQAIRLNPYNENYHVRFSQINMVLASNIAAKGAEKITDQDRQSIAQLAQQAINEAKQAVQLNPSRVSNWTNLATIYRNLINVAEGADAWAIASFQRAILLDPSNPALRLNLGGVYYGLENYEQSTRLMSEAVRLKPDWPNAYYNLAWSLFQSQKYDEAVLAMQSVTQLIVDKNSNDYQLAVKNLEEFKKKLPEPTESSQSAQLNNEALTNPVNPNQVEISPAIELPEDSGPDLPATETQETQPEATP